tara:strand:- start:245 stop:937 length:693 start_codon:yes stop_codon:yes gene_type:complete
MTQAALTLASSNRKTGGIPVSTSEKRTCPNSCPFKAKGCYAAQGHQNMHWVKVSKHERGTQWAEFCEKVAQLPKHQLWRHNVSGDLPKDETNENNINREQLEQLVKANRGRNGYTYSHYSLNAHNIALMLEANSKGFTINASTESLEAADNAKAQGLPAVVVVDSEQPTPKRTPAGHKVVQCPATLDNVTCATCGLCQKNTAKRPIVAFPAHGSQKKAVNEIVAPLSLRP